jgi:tetratricopeptide (TPR) repeat protein
MRKMLCVAAAVLAALPAGAADKKVDEAVAKAASHIAKGRAEEAEKLMDKLTQQLPTAEAWAARARVQLGLGNVEGAATSAAEGARLATSTTADAKADAFSTLATLDLERGSGADAVTHAQQAVAASATATTLAVLARAQARVGDSAALDTANEAVAAGAQSAAAHEALGEAALSLQRGEPAAAAFRKALELEPRRASARAGLANALLAAGTAAEAVAEARKATQDNAQSAEAFAVYATALYAAAEDKKAGWTEAIAAAQQGSFVSPRNPVAQVAVGRLLEADGNAGQAELAYKKALQTDPGYAPAQLHLLQIESRKGDLALALKRAQELARRQPQNLDVQLTLGRLLARNGDWVEAVEPLGKAARGMPASADVQALTGTVQQYAGQSANALTSYRRAVELAPANLEYRSTYGLLLGLNKRHAEAAAELEKVTRTPGYTHADGWVNLGWVYRNFTPPKAAESAAAYETALKLNPRNPQAALGLGWAMLVGEKYDGAIAAFNRSIDLDKANALQAYNGMGWSHYFKKDMAAAKAALEKAQAAGRGDPKLAAAIKEFELRGEQEIERRKKEVADEQREPSGSDVHSEGSILTGGGAGARAAAGRLASFGKAAVPYLLWAAVNARDIGVQRASVRSLGNIGAAAQSACPQIKAIATREVRGGIIQNEAEMAYEVALSDLRRDAQSAMSKIGCR